MSECIYDSSTQLAPQTRHFRSRPHTDSSFEPIFPRNLQDRFFRYYRLRKSASITNTPATVPYSTIRTIRTIRVAMTFKHAETKNTQGEGEYYTNTYTEFSSVPGKVLYDTTERYCSSSL